MRKKKMNRKTSETNIEISLKLDGEGKYKIDTGVEFFDHMLESFARHGFFDLTVQAQGDVGVDDHHTVEDVGLLLGDVFQKAVGDKKGIKRISHALVPMDEALSTIAVDISGRGYCVLNMEFKKPRVGDLSTENVSHFLKSFAQNAGVNINARLEGNNDHHKIEALFKSLARALKKAVVVEHDIVPSTKGIL